ncbi:MAG: hypothetical protein HQK67_07885 [Desulfamplus sp.]|nr:hypothetical protein [Desulfamplus sp.]
MDWVLNDGMSKKYQDYMGYPKRCGVTWDIQNLWSYVGYPKRVELCVRPNKQESYNDE